MKRIILHIGQPKTGSTSLQLYLSKNQEKLNDLDAVYYNPLTLYTPWIGRSNADFLLADVLNTLQDPKDKQKKEFLDKCPSLDIFRLKLDDNKISKLSYEKENFKRTIEKYKTIILSEEVIWHYSVFYDDYWQTFKDYFDNCIEEEYEVFIVLYQRRQDEWILSKWKEDVLNEIPVEWDFYETLNEYKKIGYLDYYSIIKDIEKVFGKDHVIIRVFDRERLFEHNLIKDFCHIMNLDIDVTKDIQTNQSETIKCAHALSLINKGIVKSKYTIPKNRKYLYPASTAHQKYDKENKKAHVLDKKEREDLLSELRQSNENIANEYYEGKEFFDYTINEGPVIKSNIVRDRLTAYILIFIMKIHSIKIPSHEK